MKKEYDFSNAEQGKFFRPVEELEVPVYLDEEIKNFFAKRAIAKRTRLDTMVNTILRKEMKTIASGGLSQNLDSTKRAAPKAVPKKSPFKAQKKKI